MAIPRLFISSTCYDLQEIRFQLRIFVEEIGYDPVMSEFGDIFYDLDQHVQDACKDEIKKCNMFILVVGNNYGSIYYKHKDRYFPDSITLQEFRKSIEVKIPKYIFLNRFVKYDFENYKKILEKKFATYFSENEIKDDEVDQIKLNIKKKFDKTYPFANESYQYIFYFLDEIYNLGINNAVYPFETFDNIKDCLRKQWAGFLYESLTKGQIINIDKIVNIENKLEKIENQIKLLTDKITVSDDKKNVIFDVDSFSQKLEIENLTEIQDKIDNILQSILIGEDDHYNQFPLIKFNKSISEEEVEMWVDRVGRIINEFKWSKHVPASDVFSLLPYEFTNGSYSLPHRVLLEFYGIYINFSKTDKEALIRTVFTKFSEFVVIEDVFPENNDVPF